MILYKPIDGDVQMTKIEYRPRSCFIMTQLGGTIPPIISEIRARLNTIFKRHNMTEIDAQSIVTGKDFLLKIWNLIVSVPLGIAIIDDTMTTNTLCNIFYEIGLMHTLGKETVVIKTEKAKVPSDFVRTEYIKYDSNLDDRFEKYLKHYYTYPDYYETIADQLDRNPLLAIDYIRRGYLISGNERLKKKQKKFSKMLYLVTGQKIVLSSYWQISNTIILNWILRSIIHLLNCFSKIYFITFLKYKKEV
jgi:hypothetical protein